MIVDNNKDEEEDDTFLVEEAPPVIQDVVNVSVDWLIVRYCIYFLKWHGKIVKCRWIL